MDKSQILMQSMHIFRIKKDAREVNLNMNCIPHSIFELFVSEDTFVLFMVSVNSLTQKSQMLFTNKSRSTESGHHLNNITFSAI